MVFYKPNGEILTATGETHGSIMNGVQGEHGFGYDPLFFSDDLGECLGIATPEKKNTISHRFRAIQALRNELKL